MSSSVRLSCSKGVALCSTAPTVDALLHQRGRPTVAGAGAGGAAEPVGASLHDAHAKDALPPMGVQERAVVGTGGALESKSTPPVPLSTRTAPPASE